MSETSSHDVVVLGGGSGGYAAAFRATELGLSVALIEKDKVGGTCLHRGCIPTKALLHVAELMDGIHEAAERWGVKASVDSIDFSATVANRDDVVDKNYRGLVSHLKQLKVDTVNGQGRLSAPDTVSVEGVGELRATRAVVLATGSVPKGLPGLEIDGERVITSDHALRRDTLPRSVIVLGAGAVGCEFACFYRAMGAEVTLVEALGQVLPLEDADSGREVARAMRRRGLEVLVDTKLEGAEVRGDQVTATLVDGKGGRREVGAELLLVATGREPVTSGMGFEEVGVELDRGFVVPADWATLRTSVDGVYAVGDVLPPPSLALAHASFAEGMLVAEVAAGQHPPAIDYAGVPRVTWSTPECASVGLTEAQARDRFGERAQGEGFELVTNRFPFNATAKGLVHGQGGFVKVVAVKDGPVLGVHLVGARVTDLIAEAELIYNWEALPADVAQFIHPHPTLSEAVGEAHLTLAGRALHQG